MPRPVPAGSLEAQVGMEVFTTDTPPTGGRLRHWAEDFVVEEVGLEPRPFENGKHLAVKVRLLNWEQNHFIRDASRAVRCGRNNVGFSGTKDKRALTTQWFSFLTRRPDDEVLDQLASITRCEVLDHARLNKSLRLGMHTGNAFRILVRALEGDVEDARERVDGALGHIRHLGGVPNFFGLQRFGSYRPLTHLVGRDIVHGDLEGAVMRYLADPSGREAEDILAVRKEMADTRDWKRLQDTLPKPLRFERAMVQHLSRDPEDWQGALRQLPRNLVVLFIHAYQSYLYNKVLSARIREGLPLDRAIEGDLVLPLGAGGIVPPDPEPVPVTARRLDKVNHQLAKGRGVVAAPLVGLDAPLGEGQPAALVQAVLDEEGVRPEDFASEVLPEATSTGTLRPLLAPITDLSWSVHAGSDPAVTHPAPPEDSNYVGPEPIPGPVADIRFTLPRGAYATCVLREVMKTPDALDY